MKHFEKSTRVTLYANRTVLVVMALLLLCFPVLVERYHRHFRALWKMDKLLRNILNRELFIEENVKCIEEVRWCCMGVSLICLCAAFGFPSLLFLGVIMAFLSMAVNVVCQVMKAAVELREETDLTV